MVFIDFKSIAFSVFLSILFKRNSIGAQFINVSDFTNDSNSLEINDTFIQTNLSSNAWDYTKLKSQTNGRMRSFLEEEMVFQKRFAEIRELTEFQPKPELKPELNANNSYKYPIIGYQIDFQEEANVSQDFNSNNISNSNTRNVSNVVGVKRPRYRFNDKLKSPKIFGFIHKIIVNHEDFNLSKSIDQNIENPIINENNATILNQSSDPKQVNHSFNDFDLKNTENKTNDWKMQSNASKQLNEEKYVQRFCVTSSDCETTLNERCIKHIKYSVCGCKEPFFRESISRRCQMLKLIRLLFKVSTNFTDRINNRKSIEIIQMKYSIEGNIWSVILNSSHLLHIIHNIQVIDLIDSKIVIDFYVKIADPSNDFHHKYIEYHFWYRLMSIIRGIDFSFNENDSNSFVLRAIEIVNDIQYCSVKELNYCSDYAVCIDDNSLRTKFECKCKPGMTDLSPNSDFKGEVCAVHCNIDFCGSGGVCSIRNGTDIYCICKNWNFGLRCQYSFTTVICIVAFLVILSVFFSFCLSALYCGYKINEGFTDLRKSIENNSNVRNHSTLIM